MLTQVEKRLIAAGVKNLKEFGYPNCTPENILTDCVFSQFFKSMLEDNRGQNPQADVAISSLLAMVSTTSAT